MDYIRYVAVQLVITIEHQHKDGLMQAVKIFPYPITGSSTPWNLEAAARSTRMEDFRPCTPLLLAMRTPPDLRCAQPYVGSR